MHLETASDDIAGLEKVVTAGQVGDRAAGLCHQQRARGKVPGRQVQLPEAIQPARGDVGEVERC